MWRVTVLVSALVAGSVYKTPPGTGEATSDTAATAPAATSTDAVVASIRRQLMEDNYDYMPSSSEELLPTSFSTSLPASLATAGPQTGLPLGDHVNDIFMPRARDVDPPKEMGDVNDDSGDVNKNDLLYYVHDERLRAPGAEHTTPPPTYRLLKVKSSDGRRSGVGGFVQAQWAGGVALGSVDGRPVPPLRLPRARRQYRARGVALLSDSGEEPMEPSDLTA